MRRIERDLTVVIGVRVSPALDRKLKDLGRQTRRDTSDVLRLLIENAVVGQPDLQTTITPRPEAEGVS
jgi:predicted transcriptional regulator